MDNILPPVKGNRRGFPNSPYREHPIQSHPISIAIPGWILYIPQKHNKSTSENSTSALQSVGFLIKADQYHQSEILFFFL